MELWELVARERCRDTLARYTHCGDRFLLDEFVLAFCEDGVLAIRNAEPVVGRAAIAARFRGGIGAPAPAPAPASGEPGVPAPASGEPNAPAPKRIVRHNVTNVRFETLTPTEATVASYFTVFTNIGVDHMGRYRDRLVPVGDEWLIAHRFVSTDWRAPATLFGAPS